MLICYATGLHRTKIANDFPLKQCLKGSHVWRHDTVKRRDGTHGATDGCVAPVPQVLLHKIRSARPSRPVEAGFHDEPPPVRPILERGRVRHRRPWAER